MVVERRACNDGNNNSNQALFKLLFVKAQVVHCGVEAVAVYCMLQCTIVGTVEKTPEICKSLASSRIVRPPDLLRKLVWQMSNL